MRHHKFDLEVLHQDAFAIVEQMRRLTDSEVSEKTDFFAYSEVSGSQ